MRTWTRKKAVRVAIETAAARKVAAEKMASGKTAAVMAAAENAAAEKAAAEKAATDKAQADRQRTEAKAAAKAKATTSATDTATAAQAMSTRPPADTSHLAPEAAKIIEALRQELDEVKAALVAKEIKHTAKLKRVENRMVLLKMEVTDLRDQNEHHRQVKRDTRSHAKELQQLRDSMRSQAHKCSNEITRLSKQVRRCERTSL